MASDNKTIGRFHLADIPSAPRGTPQIEVTFDIDANGILNVNAKDKTTGKEQSIRIEASSGLSDSDIEKMVNDAKKNEAEDKIKREKVDLLNQSEQVVYEIEKNLAENGDKLEASEKSNLTEKLNNLKKSKESGNVEDLKSSINELNTLYGTMAAKMTSPEPESPTGTEPNSSSKQSSAKTKTKEAEVEDADFEVVE
jgi:molecular chaperone DnaK